MAGTLETLLVRIRDGVAGAGDVEQARALVLGDSRVPDELRQIALTDADDLEGDAAGLLSVLGADSLFGALLRDAVVAEAAPATPAPTPEIADDDSWLPIAAALVEGLRAVASGFEVADAVMRRVAGVDWVWGPTLHDAVVAEAGGVDVAADVLQMLEPGTSIGVLVARAVRAEAGTVELADVVARTLGHVAVVPVADAIRAEAGTVELADAVVGALGHSVFSVAEAVRAEAGTVELAGAVATSLGHDVLPVAEAVRAEAGTAELAVAVAASLEHEVLPLAEAVRAAAGGVDIVAAVIAEIDGAAQAEVAADVVQLHPETPPVEVPQLPAAANNNRGWTWGALAIAAVALVMVGGSQLFWGLGTPLAPADQPLLFASADEVVVEELDYGSDVTVFQAEGDEGAVIIWVDEEA